MDRGHIDQEAAGQGDVAGDARAFFAERLLGDLNDHVLTGLEHFGNELRPARWAGTAALRTAIRPGAAGAAGTALEPPWGPATALVGASASSSATVASAIAPAATAEGTLKTGARVSTDAGGVAGEIFARRGSTGGSTARGASFAGK